MSRPTYHHVVASLLLLAIPVVTAGCPADLKPAKAQSAEGCKDAPNCGQCNSKLHCGWCGDQCVALVQEGDHTRPAACTADKKWIVDADDCKKP